MIKNVALILLSILVVALAGMLYVSHEPADGSPHDDATEVGVAGNDPVEATLEGASGDILDEEVIAPGGDAVDPHTAEVDEAAAGEEREALERPASRQHADALREKGDPESLHEARRMYSDLLTRGVEGEERKTLLGYLEEINDVLFFSRKGCPDAHFYTVQAGDALSRIAQHEGQSLGVIMATNGIKDANRIRVGQRIKIIEPKVWVRVDTAKLRLQLMCGDAVIREYPVGIGSYGRTPSGEFVVETRQENPDWYSPDGGVIRFGEEGHAIGTRWLGFRATDEFDGYGIHGTDEPHTVPGRESRGCIRMLNEDVEALYPLIDRGTRVVID